MKQISFVLFISGLVLCFDSTSGFAQRGRGGGGFRGGGGGWGGGGGFSAPARTMNFQQARPSGFESASPGRSTFTGPAGGTGQAGRGSGSFTTQRGGTVNYGGAAIGGTGAGGFSGGRYVGGVSVTTAGGQTINKAGRGGAAVGPGGNAVGTRSSVTGTTGPLGTGAAVSRGAVATGPGGTAAYRGGAAVGPNGAAAYRSGAAVTSSGTYYRSAAAISGQGYHVQNSFVQQYPALAARWAGYTYRPIAWAALASYGGYPIDTSTSYDYGSSVVYQDDAVYVNGDFASTASDYADQASAIANMGTQAPPVKEEELQPLGVYAMVTGEEKTSYNIFQLAISKDGILKGSYYNALTDTTEPVIGAVDKKTQRAAWTVGDKKTPTYEAGIVNLTEDETTMMVHYSKDRSQQFTLVRIKQDENAAPPAKDNK